MEQILQSRTQRDDSIYANVPGADGLHTRGDGEQRSGEKLCTHLRSPDEPRYALSSAGHVRGLRESAANVGGQSLALPSRAGGDGISWTSAYGMGRDKSARCKTW